LFAAYVASLGIALMELAIDGADYKIVVASSRFCWRPSLSPAGAAATI
jgi:hypothetical protein